MLNIVRSVAYLMSCSICLSATVYAGANDEELGWSRPWLRVLQYRDDLPGSVSLSSAGDFFAASDGQVNPVSELTTLRGFFSDPAKTDPKSGEPWACVFPARFLVLKSMLSESWLMPKCREYDEFRAGFPADEVSIVFSAAYKGNPASIFGHSFLVFNSKSEVANYRRGALLGYAVAFLADTEGEDHPVYYTLKGLFGGFQGKFGVKTYYETVNSYNNAENRDLWEYGLRLSQSERSLLVAHLWEVSRRGYFRYYFLDENCSWHMLSLLEAARPDLDLKQHSPVVTIPSETIRDLKAADLLDGEPRLRPSLRRKADWAMEPLSPDERERAASLLIGIRTAEPPRTEVWDAAIAEGQWQTQKESAAVNVDMVTRYRALLADRSRLPAASADHTKDAGQRTVTNRPDQGHALHHIELGLLGIQNGDNREISPIIGVGLGFSDLMASDTGFEPDSGIKYGTFRLRQRKSSQAFILSEGSLVEIGSYSPWRSNDPKYSWALGLSGRENAFLSLTEYLAGAAGGISLRGSWFDVRMTGGVDLVRVMGRGTDKYRIDAGPRVALARTDGALKSLVSFEKKRNILYLSDFRERDHVSGSLSYADSEQTEWRATVHYEAARRRKIANQHIKSFEISGRSYF
jgi:hypothetical protein